jgi:hypothetical protein
MPVRRGPRRATLPRTATDRPGGTALVIQRRPAPAGRGTLIRYLLLKDAPMPSTWCHPELGKFKHDGIAWISTVSMPAFKAFAYDTGYSNARRSTGKHELAFEADDEDETPSAAAVALADKVLANQKEMVCKVTEALWKDFTGQGPESGMWWHGDLDQVAEAMDADEPPAGPEDLLKVLQLSQVTVRKEVHGYKKPVVELSFHAPFEEEHGVSLLTDGKEILGIGYSSDVTPFKPAKRRASGGSR